MGHRRTRRTRKTRRTKNRRYRRQKGGENLSPSNENENKKDSGIKNTIDSITGWFNEDNWIPDSTSPSSSPPSPQSAGRRRRRKYRRTYKNKK
jgi:hypothetical protein